MGVQQSGEMRKKQKCGWKKAVKHKGACVEAELERRGMVGVPCCRDQFTSAFFAAI